VKPVADHDQLRDAIKTLPELDRAALIHRWTALFGALPPARTSRSLLVRAVAYKLQESALGGISPAIRRRLTTSGPGAKPPSPAPRAGTVLCREWQGEMHQVTVIDGGFLYRGERYASLTRLAHQITGAHRSGPAFFALKSRG
jgi:hypothetical protein